MLGKLFARKSPQNTREVAEEAGGFKYCPSCGDEFRAEFHQCSGCECELVQSASPGSTGLPAQADQRDNGQPIQPIRPGEQDLAGVSQGGLLDMKRLRNLLDRQGIPSLIEGESPDCLKSCCGGSKAFILKVRAADLESAGSLLSRDFIQSTALGSHDFPNQAGAVFDERSNSTCPACGFSFVPEEPVCPECGLCF